MKTRFALLFAAAALLSGLAPVAARAQAPLAPVPAATTTALTPTADTRAAVAAAQLIQQIDGTFAIVQRALATGIPARGNQPAVSPEAIRAALGPANVKKIEAAAAALAPPK